jgi:6-phosphogluconolactonase
VPPDHPDSNYNMTRQALLEPLGLDPARVHRMRGEASDLSVAARDYEDELVRALGSPPVFDYVMLGMGPDGHTASLFPGSPALAETRRFVVANPVDSPLTKGPATRITLTVPALNAGRHVRFLVAGADKAAPLQQVLEGPKDAKYSRCATTAGASAARRCSRARTIHHSRRSSTSSCGAAMPRGCTGPASGSQGPWRMGSRRSRTCRGRSTRARCRSGSAASR